MEEYKINLNPWKINFLCFFKDKIKGKYIGTIDFDS